MVDSGTFLLLIAFSWIILIIITNNKWVNLKNPEIGLGYAIFRTGKFNKAIDRVTFLSRSFWRWLFDIGLLVCLGFIIAALLMFSINIVKFLQIIFIDLGLLNAPTTGGSIQTVDFVPAIPGVSIGLETLPFFFVAISIAAALHELAHGVAARAEGIKLKSTGVMFFLFFFGAFVEPDEKSVTQASTRSKLRVYAAGAFTNVILVLFLIILLTPLFFNFVLGIGFNSTPQGALIVGTCPSPLDNCPADGKLLIDDVIIKAEFQNGTQMLIGRGNDFAVFSADTKPNENITLYLNGDRQVSITTVPHTSDPSRGMVGVLVNDYFQPKFSFLPLQLPHWYLRILILTLSLSLILALLNLLPVPPLDGDKIATALLQHFRPDNYKPILKKVRITTLIIVLGNLILTFIVRGWNPVNF